MNMIYMRIHMLCHFMIYQNLWQIMTSHLMTLSHPAAPPEPPSRQGRRGEAEGRAARDCQGGGQDRGAGGRRGGDRR